MKRLCDQDLSATYIHTVFQVIIVRRILYALPAWGCFLSKESSGRIEAFLKRCCRYGFASESKHVDVLLDRVCMDLFHKIRCSEHCLHHCMTFCLLHSASSMICVIGLTRLYNANVTVANLQ